MKYIRVKQPIDRAPSSQHRVFWLAKDMRNRSAGLLKHDQKHKFMAEVDPSLLEEPNNRCFISEHATILFNRSTVMEPVTTKALIGSLSDLRNVTRLKGHKEIAMEMPTIGPGLTHHFMYQVTTTFHDDDDVTVYVYNK